MHISDLDWLLSLPSSFCLYATLLWAMWWDYHYAQAYILCHLLLCWVVAWSIGYLQRIHYRLCIYYYQGAWLCLIFYGDKWNLFFWVKEHDCLTCSCFIYCKWVSSANNLNLTPMRIFLAPSINQVETREAGVVLILYRSMIFAVAFVGEALFYFGKILLHLSLLH